MSTRFTPVPLAAIAMLSLALLYGCAPSPGGGSTKGGDAGPIVDTSAIPSGAWGSWVVLGLSNPTEYYVSDTFIEKRAGTGALAAATRYPFVSASRAAAKGRISVKGGELPLVAEAEGSFALVSDSGSYYHATLKAPRNAISAQAKRQSSAAGGGRALVAAGNINLVIRNALHTKSQTIAASPSGSFSIPDAVPGDEYLVEAAGSPPVSVFSTPNMPTSEGGIVAFAGSGVAGSFKASLEFQDDPFGYKYCGTRYNVIFKVANYGEEASLQRVDIEWENTPTFGSVTDVAYVASGGSYAKGASRQVSFPLEAAEPAAGADFTDVKGDVTITDASGLVWKDKIALRFFRNDRLTFRFNGPGKVAYLYDPEGKATTATMIDPNTDAGAVQVPRRSEGYALAVLATSGANEDGYYSFALADSGNPLVEPSFDLAGYARNSAARLSFEPNDSKPALGAAAPEATTLRVGESLVSCLQKTEGATDIDWFALKGEAAPGTGGLSEDTGTPFYGAVNTQGSGRSEPALALDAGGRPHLFYYAWTSTGGYPYYAARDLALKHAWLGGSGWSEETAASLPAWTFPSPIGVRLRGDGSWELCLARYAASAPGGAAGSPCVIAGRAGAWGEPSAAPAAAALNDGYQLRPRWDPQGRLHLAYFRTAGSASSLWYSSWDGAAWSAPLKAADGVSALIGMDLSNGGVTLYARAGNAVTRYALSGSGASAAFDSGSSPGFAGDFLASILDLRASARADGSLLFTTPAPIPPGTSDRVIRVVAAPGGAGFVSAYGYNESIAAAEGEGCLLASVAGGVLKIGTASTRNRLAPWADPGLNQVLAIAAGPAPENRAYLLGATGTSYRFFAQ